MAQQQVTVELSAAAERTIRRLIQDGIAEARKLAAEQYRPIVINTPGGDRVMYVDKTGESHWIQPGNGGDLEFAERQGWVQVYARDGAR